MLIRSCALTPLMHTDLLVWSPWRISHSESGWVGGRIAQPPPDHPPTAARVPEHCLEPHPVVNHGLAHPKSTLAVYCISRFEHEVRECKHLDSAMPEFVFEEVKLAPCVTM